MPESFWSGSGADTLLPAHSNRLNNGLRPASGAIGVWIVAVAGVAFGGDVGPITPVAAAVQTARTVSTISMIANPATNVAVAVSA
jgi:hypothetical protein